MRIVNTIIICFWFMVAVGVSILATIFWTLDGILGRTRDESCEPFYEE